MYYEAYLKNNISSYHGKENRNFYENNTLKKGALCLFFSNIYKFFQIFSNRQALFSTYIVERVYYVAKEYKMSNFLDKDIQFSSDESEKGFLIKSKSKLIRLSPSNSLLVYLKLGMFGHNHKAY